jgi:hypothetical protein
MTLTIEETQTIVDWIDACTPVNLEKNKTENN